MKRSTLRLLVAGLSGPGRDDIIAILQEEFSGAIEPQLPLQPTEEVIRRRERERLKKANQRKGQAGTSGTVSPMSPDVPGDNRGQGQAMSPATVPSLSSSPSSLSLGISEKKETDTKEERENAREASQGLSPMSPSQSPGHVPVAVPSNGTGDGAFAMLVSSWADGVRSVTGAVYSPPRGRAGGALSDTLRRACNGAKDSCDRARELGAEYARANVGKTLTPFHFGDWLGSGKPERGSGVIKRSHEVQPAPATGSIWKEGT